MANKTKKSVAVYRFDRFKWACAWVLLALGLIANYYYSVISWAYRALGLMVLGAVIFAIIYKTKKGSFAVNFMREARVEMRKVSWPNRKETLQTTMLIILVVIVVAFLMWIIDGGAMAGVGWLVGQRG